MATNEQVARFGAVLGELHRLVRRRSTARAGRDPLPEAQVELLLLVRETPGISGKEVAQRLGTAPNTVSTLVRDLTDAGLLARDRDPADRRVVRLRVTEAAHRRMADYETAPRRAARRGAGRARPGGARTRSWPLPRTSTRCATRCGRTPGRVRPSGPRAPETRWPPCRPEP